MVSTHVVYQAVVRFFRIIYQTLVLPNGLTHLRSAIGLHSSLQYWRDVEPAGSERVFQLNESLLRSY
jgi:hypothetical protein